MNGALAAKLPKSLAVDVPDIDGMQPTIVSTSQPDAEWQVIDWSEYGMPFLGQQPISRCNDNVRGKP